MQSGSRPLLPLCSGKSPKLSKSVPPIKAVLFDVYGTLLISSAGDISLNNLAAENSKAACFLQKELRNTGFNDNIPEIAFKLKSLAEDEHKLLKKRA
ncbi:MAG: hypothetical protein A2096_13165 [Spirochaetes bacterium GWF1_41_5]|nr:MAG: hypothetical protein A2096_13165 [Spirochaetes bacterium GWF1_41_5]